MKDLSVTEKNLSEGELLAGNALLNRERDDDRESRWLS